MITFLRLGDYGRLGNQLFQVAATLGVAARTGRDAVFPEWAFAPWIDVATLPLPTLEGTAWTTVRPTGFAYDPSVASADAEDISLEGYFQSERYFVHVPDVVRAAIMSETMRRLSDDVAQRHAIPQRNDWCAVHVRRGDYLKFSELYAQLSIEDYYRPSIDLMRSKGIRKFLVVSDDPAWCREVLAGPGVMFGRNTGTMRDRFKNSQRIRDLASAHSASLSGLFNRYAAQRVLKDLLVMGRCRHHIIANSSFSWWSSWLSDFRDREVVAPRNWFAPELPHDTADLYRPEMTVL